MKKIARCTMAVFLVLSGNFLLSACMTLGETPGKRFERAMTGLAENCAKAKLKPNDTACDILKLKPADPLATEEGRLAHSIKIPDPVPADSGYKPGMTSEEYFDHLCKTEAGEFIYKTVENVEGLYMMRPRERATDNELSHLYALEDPYGYEDWEARNPAGIFVSPDRYKFVEMRVLDKLGVDAPRRHIDHPIVIPPRTDIKYQRYFRTGIVNQENTSQEYDVSRKSRYGYTWRNVKRSHDREFGIAGGELIILDLETNDILAIKRGFIRSGGNEVHNLTGIWWPRGQVCRNDVGRIKLTFAYHFISKILKPSKTDLKENDHGK